MTTIVIPGVDSYVALKQNAKEMIVLTEDGKIQGYDIIRTSFFQPSERVVENAYHSYTTQIWSEALNSLITTYELNLSKVVKMVKNSNYPTRKLYAYHGDTFMLYEYDLFTKLWQPYPESAQMAKNLFANSSVIQKTPEELQREEQKRVAYEELVKTIPDIDDMIELPRFRDARVHFYDPVSKIIYTTGIMGGGWHVLPRKNQESLLRYSNSIMGEKFELNPNGEEPQQE